MRLMGLAVAAVLGLVMPAAAQDTAEWNKVIEAAKKEGKVTLYTSTLVAPFHNAVIATFEKKYGIRVELLDVRASELRERIRTEQTTNRFLGDVLQNGSATTRRQRDEGVLQGHGGLPNLRNLRDPFKADDMQVPSYVLGYGVLVNTNLVKPADEPRSWKDLLEAKWKGKILSDDVRALGGGHVMFFALHDKVGRDYLEKLAGQSLLFSRDIGNDERRVARGEVPLRIPQLFSNYTLMKGLPVKLAIPEEGAPYIQFDLSILRNAPHPNAARLMIDHYLSPEAQLIYANAALIPVSQGVIEKTNPEVRELASAKLLGTTNPASQDAMLDLAKQLFK